MSTIEKMEPSATYRTAGITERTRAINEVEAAYNDGIKAVIKWLHEQSIRADTQILNATERGLPAILRALVETANAVLKERK